MAENSPLITVLIADDHSLVREGMVAVINRQTDMQVVAEASNGREAAEHFLATLPEIGLLDLRMPMVDGIDAIHAIRREVPGARLVVLTSYETDEDIYRALQFVFFYRRIPLPEGANPEQAKARFHDGIPGNHCPGSESTG
jgi:two-component system NarL family response regulator